MTSTRTGRLAVGLIGAGRLGRVYARDLASRIPETKLVAIADTVESVAKEVASEFDVPKHYADPLALIDDPAVDAYFERVATDVNRALTRCGFGLDPNGVAASNHLWRMSESQWIATFQECLENPDPSHLIRANVAFDFRQTGGGLDLSLIHI